MIIKTVKEFDLKPINQKVSFTWTVATVWATSNTEANAELIVKAVNERKALLDALEEITEMAIKWSVKGLTPTIHKAQKVINNAKNI